MTPAELALDAVLVLILVVLAWRTLFSRELFEAAVLFIAFGLTMALAWARLAAPDLALAEAAVGAGLTGVLLVHVARAMDRDHPRGGRDGRGGREERDPRGWDAQ